MTTRQSAAFAALVLSMAAGSAAFAQEATPTPEWQAAAASMTTRADVMADARMAVLDGVQSEAYAIDVFSQTPAPTLTRAEVRQDTLQALRSGEVEAINAEAVAFDTPAMGDTMTASAGMGSTTR